MTGVVRIYCRISEFVKPTRCRNGKSTAPNRFPPQIKYIIGNEACERFSYYGMIGILELT